MMIALTEPMHSKEENVPVLIGVRLMKLFLIHSNTTITNRKRPTVMLNKIIIRRKPGGK